MKLEGIGRRLLEASNDLGGNYFEIYRPDYLQSVEQKINAVLPAEFKELYEHYSFPSFVAGEIELWASDQNLQEDTTYILEGPFRDENLRAALAAYGYVQLARCSSGSYDPICMLVSGGKMKGPLVRIEHERLLLSDRLKVVRVVAESFSELFESEIENFANISFQGTR